MAQREMLRSQLDSLRQENSCLTEELRALQKRRSVGASSLELQVAESTTIVEAQRQATEDLQAELTETQEGYRDLEVTYSELYDQLQKLKDETDLNRLRAVEIERSKWESSEERLVQQLQNLQSQLQPKQAGEDSFHLERSHPPPSVDHNSSGVGSVSKAAAPLVTSNRAGHLDDSTSDHSKGPSCTTGSSTQTLLAQQQLPPLPKYSGEEQDSETFQDWITQFEKIADLCQLSSSAKLVHLTTRLRGQTFAFYRSCAPEQKSDYDLLVAELRKRFTPVRIQAVQTGQFHERKQKSTVS